MDSGTPFLADFGQTYWRGAPPAAGTLAALSPTAIDDETFRLLAEAIPTLCWVANGDGYIVWYNRRWHEYCGTTPAQMEGWGWQSVHDPDLLPEVMQRWTASIAAVQPFEMTFPLRGADGLFRPFLTRVQPVCDASGHVSRWFGVNTDVSAQHQAEDALRAAEVRALQLLERMAEAMVTVDSSFKILDINAEGLRIDGRPREAFVGRHLLDVWPHAEHLPAWAAYQRAMTEQQPVTFEYLRATTPRDQWLEVRAYPVQGGLAIFYRDISERRQAQETLEQLVAQRTAELQASEARLRTIFETSYQMQALLAPDGTLLDANATSLSIVGADAADVLGQAFWDTPWFTATPGMPEQVRRGVEDAAEGRPVRREITIAVKQGVRIYDFSIRPVRDASGTVFAMVPEAMDITHRRHAEEALRQSQKLDAMGQLTGGVAHDFNNLLTPILGSLDLLARRRLGTDREQRLIDGALQSAERAKTLVHRLLAFARRQPLQAAAVDLGVLVNGMADLIGSTLGPRIKLAVISAPGLPLAHADPHQVEMAILNLCVNARDAMMDGGELTITTAAQMVPGGHRAGLVPGHYVSLSVADTGAGMDEEVRARAIEPFFSTKGVGRGTGLGLSMVHGLVRQLNGGLDIASKPGCGTAVTLWLPVSSQPPPLAKTELLAPPQNPQGTVLLVDDEDLVRASTAHMLAELGYTVVEARGAEEALRLLESTSPLDLMITDHLMPGMTGVDLARAARPGLHVLIISGFAEAEGITPGLPRLTKPFRQADLAASLAALGRPRV